MVGTNVGTTHRRSIYLRPGLEDLLGHSHIFRRCEFEVGVLAERQLNGQSHLLDNTHVVGHLQPKLLHLGLRVGVGVRDRDRSRRRVKHFTSHQKRET